MLGELSPPTRVEEFDSQFDAGMLDRANTLEIIVCCKGLPNLTLILLSFYVAQKQ